MTYSNITFIKEKVHPKMKIQSLPIQPHADGKMVGDLKSTNHFWSIAAKLTLRRTCKQLKQTGTFKNVKTAKNTQHRKPWCP